MSRSAHEQLGGADWQHMLHARLGADNDVEIVDDSVGLGGVEVVELTAEHGGYNLQFPEGDYIAEEIKRRGVPYEFPLLVFLRHALPRDAVVIDIGANVGNHAIYLATAANALVHAFEPSTEALFHLRRNVASNQLSHLIDVHAVALGREAGSANLADRRKGNLGATRIQSGAGPIRMLRLDDYAFERVDLIKIDVEGAELDVLAGAAITILDHRPLVIAEAKESGDLVALDAALGDLGYLRWSRNLSPLCTPSFLFAPNRRALGVAIARNGPRVIANRTRSLVRRLRLRQRAS